MLNFLKIYSYEENNILDENVHLGWPDGKYNLSKCLYCVNYSFKLWGVDLQSLLVWKIAFPNSITFI